MIRSKIVSSLEKIFTNDEPEKFATLEKISALKGERVSFQVCCRDTLSDDEKIRAYTIYKIELFGSLEKYAKVRVVKQVAAQKPVSIETDEFYLKTEPGIFPDLLHPLTCGDLLYSSNNLSQSLWIDLELPEDISEIGDNELTVRLTNTTSGAVSENKLTVRVIDAVLPPQKLLCTQWVSFESIWRYYAIKPYSKKFFDVLDSTLYYAAKNGMNMVLLNVFSGSVQITKKGDKYSFSYKRFDKVIEIAKSHGITRFEVDHLFSSGNAEYASRVRVVEDGAEKTIFKNTSSTAPEYTAFLRAFLKSLIKHMKSLGEDKNLVFHIADEPAKDKIETFRAARETVIDIIGEYEIIDALFDIEYYKQGLVTAPVPINGKIEPFLEAKVPNLWTYYCCGPGVKYANRFMSMPSAQSRSIGMQMYKYRLVGFLHWGLNYYMNAEATAVLNPYLDNSGENWVSAGDPFVLYPGADGSILESLRLLVFHDAIQDIRAMELCESFYSHDAVVCAIEEVFGKTLEFNTCAYDGTLMLAIRERVNEMIERAINK